MAQVCIGGEAATPSTPASPRPAPTPAFPFFPHPARTPPASHHSVVAPGHGLAVPRGWVRLPLNLIRRRAGRGCIGDTRGQHCRAVRALDPWRVGNTGPGTLACRADGLPRYPRALPRAFFDAGVASPGLGRAGAYFMLSASRPTPTPAAGEGGLGHGPGAHGLHKNNGRPGAWRRAGAGGQQKK